MTTPDRCSSCGEPLPADAPRGLCPQCLLDRGSPTADSPDRQPPHETAPKQTIALSFPPTEQPGERIGPYKLLQQLGEGGCGIVYLAEQTEPVRRRVALKVIKPGMDTKQVLGRFEAERQALALMDHPHIAKVFDAGSTTSGRPYFVMELVKGIPLTRYCDENKLSTEQRLKLFIQVCQAIQHAHQKGIIHRDIKPTNILAADHDGVPVPKIIDFGIAKATSGQTLTDKTVFTAFEQFIGTPAYMAPEQALLSGLDIDTRSDIYSLGVLLYELLTGKTPFDSKKLVAAGLDEIRRVIREVEPPRPSTRLSTLAPEEQTTVAGRRQSEPPKLIHLVQGDLDWIAMKCLEKDRNRRYETANGLAMDIQRHLGNEPVVARPPSVSYQAQKFIGRNKAALAVAGSMVLLLVTGTIVSTWQAVRATRAERQAKAEASKSAQVSQFLKDMLKGVEPSVALGRDATMLREILDNTAERVGNDLKNHPDVEAELLNTIGTTFYELGEWPKAEAMHREALRLRKAVFGETNELVATSLNNLGNALWRQGERAEAEELERQALAIRRKLLGNEHPDVADSLTSLARVLMYSGKRAEAEILQREAVAIQRKQPGNKIPDLVEALNQFSAVLVGYKNDEAEIAVREALVLSKTLPGDGHPSMATSLLQLGYVLEKNRDLAGAESMCREAVTMRRKLLGNEHPLVASALDRHASVLGSQGKLGDAIVLLRECLAIREKQMPADWQVFTARIRLGECLLDQQQYAEAEPLLLSGYKGLEERENRVSAKDKPYLRRVVQALMLLYETTGKPDKAADWNLKLAEFKNAPTEAGPAAPTQP